jgi:hypothetical protein
MNLIRSTKHSRLRENRPTGQNGARCLRGSTSVKNKESKTVVQAARWFEHASMIPGTL